MRTIGAPARPRRPDLRRAALLDAAAKLFIDRGVANTTIDEIAAEADVAKGTFYHYFGAKTDLLAGLQDRFMQAFQDRLAGAIKACEPDDWTGKRDRWVEEVIDALFDMRALHDVAFHQSEQQGPPQFADLAFVRSFADLLAEGAAAGAWTAESPDATALIIFHGLHGAADEALLAGRGPETLSSLAITLVSRMLPPPR